MKSNRISRVGILALLLVGCMGVTVRAQEEPVHPQPKQAATDEARRGPGRQLVHGSREAAGEEKDEMGEFKHSASVSWISSKLHISLQSAYWLSYVLNFVVIAGAIVWASRKFLPGIFRDRTAAIQKAMQEAQKASEEARRRLADIESRLQKLDVEIGMMRDAAEKEGEAHKIVAMAEQEIVAAVKAARRQLTAHAADLAVGLAQKQIHVDPATDQALVRNFAGQLGSASDTSGKDGN
jgi:F-type H+-transporting ATPase subunit b